MATGGSDRDKRMMERDRRKEDQEKEEQDKKRKAEEEKQQLERDIQKISEQREMLMTKLRENRAKREQNRSDEESKTTRKTNDTTKQNVDTSEPQNENEEDIRKEKEERERLEKIRIDIREMLRLDIEEKKKQEKLRKEKEKQDKVHLDDENELREKEEKQKPENTTLEREKLRRQKQLEIEGGDDMTQVKLRHEEEERILKKGVIHGEDQISQGDRVRQEKLKDVDEELAKKLEAEKERKAAIMRKCRESEENNTVGDYEQGLHQWVHNTLSNIRGKQQQESERSEEENDCKECMKVMNQVIDQYKEKHQQKFDYIADQKRQIQKDCNEFEDHRQRNEERFEKLNNTSEISMNRNKASSFVLPKVEHAESTYTSEDDYSHDSTLTSETTDIGDPDYNSTELEDDIDMIQSMKRRLEKLENNKVVPNKQSSSLTSSLQENDDTEQKLAEKIDRLLKKEKKLNQRIETLEKKQDCERKVSKQKAREDRIAKLKQREKALIDSLQEKEITLSRLESSIDKSEISKADKEETKERKKHKGKNDEKKEHKQVKEKESHHQRKEREPHIEKKPRNVVYKSPTIPKLTEETFEEWKSEVLSILTNGIYTEEVLRQDIRNSLTGNTRKVLLNLETDASTQVLIAKLEKVYGNVKSGEAVLTEFYNSKQKDDESVRDWGVRVENILIRAIKKGKVDAKQKDKMLRNRFWRNLRSEKLRNATRIFYETEKDFENLCMLVRTEEDEMRSSKDNEKVQGRQITKPNKEDDDQTKMMKDLLERMKRLEEQMSKPNRNSQNKGQNQQQKDDSGNKNDNNNNNNNNYNRGGYRGNNHQRGGYRGNHRGRGGYRNNNYQSQQDTRDRENRERNEGNKEKEDLN